MYANYLHSITQGSYLRTNAKEFTLTLLINIVITYWLISQIKSYLKYSRIVRYKEEKDAI